MRALPTEYIRAKLDAHGVKGGTAKRFELELEARAERFRLSFLDSYRACLLSDDSAILTQVFEHISARYGLPRDYVQNAYYDYIVPTNLILGMTVMTADEFVKVGGA